MFPKIPWEGWKVAFWAPNIITTVRLLLSWVPPVLLLMDPQSSGMRWWAFVVFALIAATDGLDGGLARRTNKTSRWGAFLDPVADKLLVTATLIALVVVYTPTPYGWLIAAVTVFILAREIILFRQIGRRNEQVTKATTLGKAKMVFQAAMIALYVSPVLSDWRDWGALGVVLMLLVPVITAAALIFTLMSWIEYYQLYVRGKPILKKS